MQARIACLALVAASGGKPDKAAVALIHHITKDAGFAPDLPPSAINQAIDLALTIADAEGGMDTLVDLIATTLRHNTDTPYNMASQAYAWTAEFVARTHHIAPEQTRILDILAEHLNISRLVRAAIDTSAAIRFTALEG